MISKERTTHSRQITKTTFKAESIVLLLLQQFQSLAPKLQRLLTTPILNQCHLDQVITICKKIPKSLERNIHITNQLQICKQLTILVDNFLKSSTKKQFKPYSLFLLWKHFQEKITNRVQMGIKTTKNNQNSNPDNESLFAFIYQLDQISELLEEWANHKTKQENQTVKYQAQQASKHQQPIEIIYPTPSKKTAVTTNRETLASTAQPSTKISKHQKRSTYNQFNTQSHQQHLLFRASTAKLERKPLNIAVRCPSAAQLLKNQAKQSQFQATLPKRVSKNSKSSVKLGEEIQQFKLTDKFFKSHISRFGKKQNMGFGLLEQEQEQNHLNISFLHKEIRFQGNNQRQERLKSKNDPTSMNIIKSRENSESNIAIETISQKQARSKKEKEPKTENVQNIESIQFIQRTQRRKPTVFSSRVISRAPSNVRFEEDQDSSQSCQADDQEQLYKINSKRKKVVIKKIRRSGKYFIKNQNDELVEVSASSSSKSIKSRPKSRRRRAVLNNTDLIDLKNTIVTQEQIEQQKKLQFEDNVFLAVADVLKSKKKITNKDPKIQSNSRSLSNFLADMNNFLNQNPFESQKDLGSVFFKQQEQLRQSEDAAMKERVKKLMKHKNQLSNIFEMGYRSASNKDVIYNQIHRKECFQSDQEWIKHTTGPFNPLLQKAL